MAKQEYQSAVIKATLMWANLGRVNEMSDKFQVDCAQLDDTAIAKLETIGITPRVCEKEGENNRGTFITVKSTPKDEEWQKSEDDLRWFKVTDAGKNPIEDLNSIGNGTIAFIRVDAVPYVDKKSKKDMISNGLNQIVITELVEYSDSNDDELYEAAQEEIEASMAS